MIATSRRIKAVLFDHDGTLVDSEPAHFQMWVEVLRPHGVLFTESQYKLHHAGVPTDANAVSISQRYELGVSPAELANAKNAATSDFLSRQAFALMPGARNSIATLRKLGLRLAIVTGAGRLGVEATIRTHGLEEHFASVVSGDDVQRSKPAPDCYLLAMQRLGVRASECVAIEDTEHGVAAASSAGIACLAVPTSMSEHHDFSQAVRQFRNLDEVTDWLVDHCSTPVSDD